MLIFYNFQLHLYILDEELFTDGTLLGSVRGPAHPGVVPIEALSPSPQGYYVILQKDSTEQEEDRQQLRVAEFVAYGSYDASIAGFMNTSNTKSRACYFACVSCCFRYTRINLVWNRSLVMPQSNI